MSNEIQWICIWAQEIKLRQKQNSLNGDPFVLTTNPERASILISALGWAQDAGVEISVDEFNTDYEVYGIIETQG